jgi:hypothetical protein
MFGTWKSQKLFVSVLTSFKIIQDEWEKHKNLVPWQLHMENPWIVDENRSWTWAFSTWILWRQFWCWDLDFPSTSTVSIISKISDGWVLLLYNFIICLFTKDLIAKKTSIWSEKWWEFPLNYDRHDRKLSADRRIQELLGIPVSWVGDPRLKVEPSASEIGICLKTLPKKMWKMWKLELFNNCGDYNMSYIWVYFFEMWKMNEHNCYLQEICRHPRAKTWTTWPTSRCPRHNKPPDQRNKRQWDDKLPWDFLMLTHRCV